MEPVYYAYFTGTRVFPCPRQNRNAIQVSPDRASRAGIRWNSKVQVLAVNLNSKLSRIQALTANKGTVIVIANWTGALVFLAVNAALTLIRKIKRIFSLLQHLKSYRRILGNPSCPIRLESQFELALHKNSLCRQKCMCVNIIKAMF